MGICVSGTKSATGDDFGFTILQFSGVAVDFAFKAPGLIRLPNAHVKKKSRKSWAEAARAGVLNG